MRSVIFVKKNVRMVRFFRPSNCTISGSSSNSKYCMKYVVVKHVEPIGESPCLAIAKHRRNLQ